MKLYSFSVTNFRSITSAHRVPVEGTTVLLGKNNEGKTNLLHALQIAMELLTDHALGRVRAPRYRLSRSITSYDWTRDFPIPLQGRATATQTIFRLNFQLNDEEIEHFKEEIGSSFNGDLPIEVKVGKSNMPKIDLKKSGKNTKALTKKPEQIAKFVAQRIFFNYIPAVRTDKEANEVIDRMLSHELRGLELQDEYKEALKVIDKLQKPVLDDLADRIRLPLSTFLPTVVDVKIEIPEHTRRVGLRRNFSVVIDDGTPTNLEYKGDGVKSLAALALLRSRISRAGASIVAIEEPESHLHPGAIHQLNEILSSIEEDNQVILTTHNPLFVNRRRVKSNIIVDSGKAVAAKNIEKIREVLGVHASDNLMVAGFVLVVEGDEDVRALSAILPLLSKKLGDAISTGLLVIDSIGGAGNLSYKLSMLQKMLCVTHTLLDNDESGQMAFDKAEHALLISIKNCTMVKCKGMPESEFEDCLLMTTYCERVQHVFGVDLNCKEFKTNRKWSKRIENTFIAQGKPWGKNILKQVKHEVAKEAEEQPLSILNKHKRNSIDALVTALEATLGS